MKRAVTNFFAFAVLCNTYVFTLLLCVCVCVRVCSYVIWCKKGYQEFGGLVSATTTKVKGIAVHTYSSGDVHIYDVGDYVKPALVYQLT